MSYYYPLEINQDPFEKHIIIYHEDSLAGNDFSLMITPDGKMFDMTFKEGESMEEVATEITNLFEYLENKLRELDEEANKGKF